MSELPPWAVALIAPAGKRQFAGATRPLEKIPAGGGVERLYGFPGGKLDPGETPLQAVIREAIEEGWDPEGVDPEPVFKAESGPDFKKPGGIWWYRARAAKMREDYKEKERLKPILLKVRDIRRKTGIRDDEAIAAYLAKMQAEKTSEVTLDINKGDILLGGKYKNSPITVEEIGTDELGQPTVNGRKLLAYRIKKKMPEKTAMQRPNLTRFLEKIAALRQQKTADAEKTVNNLLYSSMIAPILGAGATQVIAKPLVENLMRDSDKVTPRDIEVMHRTTNRSRVAAGEKPVQFYRGFDNSPLAGKEGVGVQMLRRQLENNAAYIGEMKLDGKEIPAHVIVGDKLKNSKVVGSLLGHEFGHAQPGRLGGAKGQMLARMLSMALLAPAAGSVGYSKGRGDKSNTLQKTLLGLGAAGTGGVLAEEARASLKARAMLKRLGKSPVGLRRAYLTYLLGSLGAGGAAAGGGVLFGKWDEAAKKNKRKKHAMLKLSGWAPKVNVGGNQPKGTTPPPKGTAPAGNNWANDMQAEASAYKKQNLGPASVRGAGAAATKRIAGGLQGETWQNSQTKAWNPATEVGDSLRMGPAPGGVKPTATFSNKPRLDAYGHERAAFAGETRAPMGQNVQMPFDYKQRDAARNAAVAKLRGQQRPQAAPQAAPQAQRPDGPATRDARLLSARADLDTQAAVDRTGWMQPDKPKEPMLADLMNLPPVPTRQPLPADVQRSAENVATAMGNPEAAQGVRENQRAAQEAAHKQRLTDESAARNAEHEQFMAARRAKWPKTGQFYEKVAKFMISKGPDTAKEFMDGLRKALAAKALEKAPAEVAETAKKVKKPSSVAKLIKKKKKSKPLYGQPTGHGTAAFRFGD